MPQKALRWVVQGKKQAGTITHADYYLYFFVTMELLFLKLVFVSCPGQSLRASIAIQTPQCGHRSGILTIIAATEKHRHVRRAAVTSVKKPEACGASQANYLQLTWRRTCVTSSCTSAAAAASPQRYFGTGRGAGGGGGDKWSSYQTSHFFLFSCGPTF